MDDLSLCYLSATAARGCFQRGELSPASLVEALLARAEAVEPALNATTYLYGERALEQARAAEVRYQAASDAVRPLEGLPIMIKDGHDLGGEITTYGSQLYADYRPARSYFHIDRLIDAGAIVLGRTTTPEFGASTICHSKLWGVTRNPWNLAMSPAGSGGGAGAALAAGMTPLADGSDYGGSVRNPASACGIIGFKSPTGRIPKPMPYALNNWSSFGPMTRTVDDAALLYDIMNGYHPEDLASLPGRVTLGKVDADISGWRIAFSPDLGFFQVDPEVAANTRQALKVFEAAGAVIEEVTLPWTEETLLAALAHYCAYEDSESNMLSEEQKSLLTDYVARSEDYTKGGSLPSLWRSQELRGEMYTALAKVFETCDLLVTPTLAVPSVPAEHHPLDDVLEINGVKVDPTLGWVLCYPFNMLGQLPVMSLPSGLASNGVPTGLQIIGKPFQERPVFTAAKAYEAAHSWFQGADARPKL